MACAYRAGTTAENEWNYTKLMNYRDRAINTDFFKHFWQNMSNQCSNFKDYQDDFFFLHYTYPATQKIGINLAMMRNLQNEGESVKEYLTCLTSYIFSITPQAQVNGMTFGKGDVVPFLYYKDKKHANIDVRNDSDALMDIAKYAYVALIEGWCTLPTPYHLWENEYNWLFGNYEPENLDYDLETLHQWYDETYQRYCKDKGRKGNNLLGSTIEHIIESDYSIEQQLEATEYYIRGIFNDLGIETDFKETMARNELMAKYMMQNSNFDATIKDYNVTIEFMTENLQRGTHEEQNTHTVVTSDFQKLEFQYTMDKRNVNHSDEDGISDGAELGNEKWINITEFVRRTYEDAVRKGDPHKATFEEQVEDIIEKNGAYTDFGGNKVYGSVKWNDDKTKVLYRVYDYKSNPKLNDTDFDGINDNTDNKPLNNYHNVKMDIEENRRLSMTHGSEYRHFAGMPNKYNSELAQMSLVFSNIANGGREIDIDQDLNGNINITQYMQTVGFMPLTQVNLFNNRGKAYIGLKELQYYNNKKYIYGVFVGGFTDKTSFQELLFDTTGLVEDKFKNIASTIKNQLDNYKNLSAGNNCCYFVTGMDIAGGVANILASELLDEEVYCYTFDPPNISKEDKGVYTYIKNIVNEDSLIPKAYNKNDGYHINGDIYNQSIRYDIEYRSYLRDELKGYKGDYKISNSLKDEINDIKITYVNDNNINEFFKEISEKLYGNRLTPVPVYMYNSKGKINYMHLYEDKYEYDIKYLKKCGFIDDLLTPIENIMYGMVEAINKTSTNIKDASETEVKSVEAGEINGFDKEDHYDDKVDEVNSESINNGKLTIKEALDKIGEWYIKNVYTYQAGNYGRYRANVKKTGNVLNDENEEADFLNSLKVYNDDGNYFVDDNGNFYYISNYPIVIHNVEKNTYWWYKDEADGIIPITKELYNNVRNLHMCNVTYTLNGESKTTKLEIEDEIKYQKEYKSRFKSLYNKASQEAKNKRQNLLGAEYEKIYSQYDDTSNPIILMTKNKEAYEDLNVDKLVQKERFRASNRCNSIDEKERGYYYCDELGKDVGDDCSGFVSAVLNKFLKSRDANNEVGEYGSYSLISGEVYNILHDYGFTLYKSKKSSIDDEEILTIKDLKNSGGLKEGDIIISPGNHVEFFINKNQSFSWGNVYATYPRLRSFDIFEKKNGNTVIYYYCKDKVSSNNDDREYTAVYRWNGDD